MSSSLELEQRTLTKCRCQRPTDHPCMSAHHLKMQFGTLVLLWMHTKWLSRECQRRHKVTVSISFLHYLPYVASMQTHTVFPAPTVLYRLPSQACASYQSRSNPSSPSVLHLGLRPSSNSNEDSGATALDFRPHIMHMYTPTAAYCLPSSCPVSNVNSTKASALKHPSSAFATHETTTSVASPFKHLCQRDH